MPYDVGNNDEAYRIQICDHILDNIYGQIGLTEVERALERLPIFKRLHNISQLGLVNLIFPCALHTRYTHSLGVMHIAGEMASRINRNMKCAFFDDSDIQIIRLAGLLHDIGHYPMSHNIEQAYQDSRNLQKYREEEVSKNLKYYTNCPGFLSPLSPPPEDEKEKKLQAEEDFVKGFSGSDGMHHEYMGCQIIAMNQDIYRAVRDNFVLLNINGRRVLNPKFAIWKKGDDPCTSVDEERVGQITSKLLWAIGEMVRGNYENRVDELYPWLEKYSAMIQIIHSDMDADNFDYLMRDATFSGTSYGLMDMGVLLNCIVVCPLKQESTGKTKYIIGVQKKGVGCVEQFLLNKFLAYSQMILTKYVSILEAMLLKLEAKYIIPEDRDYTCDKLSDLAKSTHSEVKYLAFTDHYIHQKVFAYEEMKNALSLLPCAIVTHLANSSALHLVDNDEYECICTGIDSNAIRQEIMDSAVYQRFLDVYEQVKDKNGDQINNTDLDAQLFSFRFETYSLTKQIPIEDFKTKFLFSGMEANRRFNFFYYRFGSGIPVLEKGKTYSYCEDSANNAILDGLPILSVDTPQSSLRDLCSMKYVSIRQYNVCKYSSQ